MQGTLVWRTEQIHALVLTYKSLIAAEFRDSDSPNQPGLL